jgi:sirohydrochlorin cobaltochelatase
MIRNILTAFADWLGNGPRTIGQIAIARTTDGWELRHIEDAGDLRTYTRWEDARVLANTTDTGAFRPIKTTRDLRHGWLLQLSSVADVRRALDYFYPGMIGLWHAETVGELQATDLRDTLARQTGMYRITQKITDEQAQAMIGKQCSTCQKTMLWKINAAQAITSLPPEKHQRAEFPLLCREACNLLVGLARGVVKEAEKAAAAST